MLTWLEDNKDWMFSGVGVTIVGALLAWLRREPKQSDEVGTIKTNNISIVNNVHTSDSAPATNEAPTMKTDEQVRRVKDSTRILFIDDDDKFKVVKILKNSGWTNTEIIKDVTSLDDRQVVEADIYFVDVQGVGVKLGFKDEGLGLAAALKDRYPNKKVVIYSAEPRGERFHKALRKADAALEKNADPYEFQQLVDGFVGIA